jgi:hypothetical protein
MATWTPNRGFSQHHHHAQQQSQQPYPQHSAPQPQQQQQFHHPSSVHGQHFRSSMFPPPPVHPMPGAGGGPLRRRLSSGSESFSSGSQRLATQTPLRQPAEWTVEPFPRQQPGGMGLSQTFHSSHLLFPGADVHVQMPFSGPVEVTTATFELQDGEAVQVEEEVLLEVASVSTRTSRTTTTTTNTTRSGRRGDRTRTRDRTVDMLQCRNLPPHFRVASRSTTGNAIEITLLTADNDRSSSGRQQSRGLLCNNKKLAKKSFSAPNRGPSGASGGGGSGGRSVSSGAKQRSSRGRSRRHRRTGEDLTPRLSPMPAPQMLPVLVALPSSVLGHGSSGLVELNSDLMETLTL